MVTTYYPKNKKILYKLLKDYNNDINFIDGSGYTLLHRAVQCDDYELIHILLSYGANPNVQDTVLESTPLHIAVEYEYTDIIKLLLKYGADPNIQDWEMESCVHKAIWSKNVDIIKLLASKRINVDLKNKMGHNILDNMQLVFENSETVYKLIVLHM